MFSLINSYCFDTLINSYCKVYGVLHIKMPTLRMLLVEPSNIAGKKLETSKATPLDNFRRQSELLYFQTK